MIVRILILSVLLPALPAWAEGEADCLAKYERIGMFQRLFHGLNEEELAKVKWDQIFSKDPFLRTKDGVETAVLKLEDAEAMKAFENHLSNMKKAMAKSGTLPAYTQEDWMFWLENTKYPYVRGKRPFPYPWLHDNAQNIYENYLKKGKTLQDFYLDQWGDWYVNIAEHDFESVKKALEHVRSNDNFAHIVERQALRWKGYVNTARISLPQAVVTSAITGFLVGGFFDPTREWVAKTVRNWVINGAQWVKTGAQVKLMSMDSQQEVAMRAAYQGVDLAMAEWRQTNYSYMRSGAEAHFRSMDRGFQDRMALVMPLVSQVDTDFEAGLRAEITQNVGLVDSKLTKIIALQQSISAKKKLLDGSQGAPNGEDQASLLSLQSQLDAADHELAVVLGPWQMLRFMHKDLSDVPEATRKTYQNAFDQYVASMQLDHLKTETLVRMEKFQKIVESSGLISTVLKPKEKAVEAPPAPPLPPPEPSSPPSSKAAPTQ